MATGGPFVARAGRGAAVTEAPAGARAELWLPFLRRLTEAFPRWAVWKNVESALTGHGDVDSFAPPGDWPAIEAAWIAWLRSEGLGPAIVCRHVPQGPHFVALDGSPWLLQFDVKVRGTFRGSTLIDVDDLLALAETDARGFRRIRPGAEGVLKLLYNGMRLGGRPDPAGLAAKNVVGLLEADPAGARLAARRLLGPAAGAMMRAVEALVEGRWDRAALVTVEGWAAARAVAEPHVAASRLWFGAVLKKRCPVLRVIRERDRRLPEDTKAWLARVARDHRVIRLDD
jgi:hypothetical protein